MKKLKLDLAALRVETFVAGAELAPRAGTIRANDASGAESCGPVTYCMDTCFCANTSPRPSCDDCSWDGCPSYDPDGCGFTYGDTCFCANTSPRPSCDECSWDGCASFDPAGCP